MDRRKDPRVGGSGVRCVCRLSDMLAMTAIADLVEPLKRELAVPGQFQATYPGTSDDDLAGSLLDGLGRVQLIGFLTTAVVDLELATVTPDLSPAAKALVVLFAADSILRMRLLELNQRSLYEAGPVKYETEKAASTLTEILRGLERRRQEILELATGVGRASSGIGFADMYGERVAFYRDELAPWHG